MLVIPEGYVLIRDAYNEVGRELFGEDWTDLGIAVENDKTTEARRNKAERVFRARAIDGIIEVLLVDTDTGYRFSCPQECWLADPIDIDWLSSTLGLVHRPSKKTVKMTGTQMDFITPEEEDYLNRDTMLADHLRFHYPGDSPIKGLEWYQRYRVLVRQAPAAAGAQSMSEASPRESTPMIDQSQKSDESAKTDSYRTGGPGRPSIRHLIRAEFERRIAEEKGNIAPTLAEEARRLAVWAGETHKEAPTISPRTIENHIRGIYREAMQPYPTK